MKILVIFMICFVSLFGQDKKEVQKIINTEVDDAALEDVSDEVPEEDDSLAKKKK